MSLCSTVNVKIKYWCQSIFIFLSRCLLSRPVTEDSSGLIIFCLFCFPWMCFRGQKTCAWLLFLYSYSRNNFEIGVANSMHTPLLWSTLDTPPPEDWLATASTVLSLSLKETKMADRLFFTGYRLQLLNAYTDCAANESGFKFVRWSWFDLQLSSKTLNLLFI